MNAARLADRKALLVTRADLDRTRLALAAREIRTYVLPKRNVARVAELRPKAALIVAFAAPFIGLRRFARIVRFASYALAGIRLVSHWRR
jgi:hypothetical protein